MPSKLDEPQEINEHYQLTINTYEIRKAGMILRALDHELRRELIRLIHQNKSIAVTQLYTELRLEQSVVSQHLAILRKAGIVTILRQGKHNSYSMNARSLHERKNFAVKLAG